jgi:molybdate transport system substrate-binding protein
MRLPALLFATFAPLAHAAEVQVAVAANFAAPMKVLAAQFGQRTGHVARLSVGATGKFYAQIVNGAPFDVLLAADAATPARLEREGLAVKGSRYTYATGRLVLWSADPALVDAAGAVLKQGRYAHLALANPTLAPYGAAARETLGALGLASALEGRLVQAENIAQAHQFVASGNAELGFVALSQVWLDGRLQSGSAWIVPANLYAPLRQDAVLLARAKDNPAALELLRFLRSAPARAVMTRYGY